MIKAEAYGIEEQAVERAACRSACPWSGAQSNRDALPFQIDVPTSPEGLVFPDNPKVCPIGLSIAEGVWRPDGADFGHEGLQSSFLERTILASDLTSRARSSSNRSASSVESSYRIRIPPRRTAELSTGSKLWNNDTSHDEVGND